jgi:hypothetical protein
VEAQQAVGEREVGVVGMLDWGRRKNEGRRQYRAGLLFWKLILGRRWAGFRGRPISVCSFFLAILFLSRNTVSFLAILIEVCILIYAFYFSNCVSRAQVNNFND